MSKIENPNNGCWLDGNLGQHQGYAIVNLTDDMLDTSYGADWPHGEDGKALGLYGETGNPWAALNGDEHIETMVEIMDECVAALNENTEGNGCWEWQDGDFGYYEHPDDEQEPF